MATAAPCVGLKSGAIGLKCIWHKIFFAPIVSLYSKKEGFKVSCWWKCPEAIFFNSNVHTNFTPKLSPFLRGQMFTGWMSVTSAGLINSARKKFCVAGAPNKESCKNRSYAPGICMHALPAEPKVKAKWVKFVQKHCIDFDKPVSRYAALCSAHFKKHCFQNDIAWSIGFVRRRDLIGGSIPTRDTIIPDRKLQVSEYFDMLAFLYKIHRISDVSCINYLHRPALYPLKVFFETSVISMLPVPQVLLFLFISCVVSPHKIVLFSCL